MATPNTKSGSQLIAGYVRVGSHTPPVNITNGDITGERLMLGANTAFGTAVGGFANFFHVAGTNVATAAGANVLSAYFFTHDPPSAPSAAAQYRSLYYQNRIIGDVDYSGMTQFTSGFFEGARLNVELSAGTFPPFQVMLLSGLILDSSGPGAALGTVPSMQLVQMNYTSRPSGTDTATATDIRGLSFPTTRLAAATSWTHDLVADIYIENPQTNTSNTHVGLLMRTLSRAVNENISAWFNDGRVAIGGDGPAGYGLDGQDGISALTRLMYGLELRADEMNTTNKFTAALKFMSTDSAFTTENPKFLAAIVGEATQTYSGDTTGGMGIGFYTTLNTPGATNVPVRRAFLSGDSGFQILVAATRSVLTLQTEATNDDVTEDLFQFRTATTDATVTTLATVAAAASTTVMLEARVTARRTGGAAGTAEDGAGYIITAVVKNVAGTATLIGTATTTVVGESQAGWDAIIDVTGANWRVRVTGAVDNDVTWHATVRRWYVGT